MSAERDYVAGALPPGTRLGVWQIDHLIARGGAGEVYAASRADGAFQQRAALKLLQHGAVAEASRFQIERDILARLEHPGIARLLDGGVAGDGRPYMVMEYVEGTSLTEYCDRAHLGLAGRLKLFGEVCEVVSYAHRCLVVHRDLKPRNIFVTQDGRVKLLDFGVAKLLDTVSPVSELTSAPLTPDYAAPEQLTGQPITTATDVYALGVVLFELLTARKPFKPTDMPVAEAVRAVLHDQPPTPSRAARSGTRSAVPARLLEGDLDAIVAKCLRKEPEHRYESVAALQRDLQRFLNDEPVSAREGARLYVLGRFLRRHRWMMAAGALVFLALASSLAMVSWQARRIAEERDIARRAAAREEAVRHYVTRMFRSSAAAKSGAEPLTAKAMLDRTAQRVLNAYRDDPYLTGKVVETLSDLYGSLEDIEGQVPLLEGFLKQAGPEADPESVALARQKFANVELQRGNTEHAQQLLAQAQAFWDTDPKRYPEQRLEGMVVQGRLQRTLHDIDGSIATYNAAIRERIALSGKTHSETAALYNSLAIAYMNANRFSEALNAYTEALDIQKALQSADDLEALIMRANAGILEARYGRIADAESELRTAFEKQQALSGDSAAVASAMSYYGAVLSARGRHEEGIAALRTSLKMAVQFTGPASPLSVQIHLFLAEALMAAGQNEAASNELEEGLRLGTEKLGADSLFVLRLRLGQARLTLAKGDMARAAAEAAALFAPLREIGATARPVLAQALVTRGEALIAEHRMTEAVPLLTEAVQIREALLWGKSWELAEARARLGEALGAKDAHGRELLTQAVSVLESQLGAEHPQTVRARRALAVVKAGM
ncbi:MAG TPA: serine/threonine-protein kinase [Steroidobacteraceae bacterium]|nr:serine/threonine-protein kinase [Steroidobacteraceae bacterium]